MKIISKVLKAFVVSMIIVFLANIMKALEIEFNHSIILVMIIATALGIGLED